MNFSFAEPDLELLRSELQDCLGSLKNKVFLISGASGFFGRNLLESLLYLNNIYNLNIKIYAISRDKNDWIINIDL